MHIGRVLGLAVLVALVAGCAGGGQQACTTQQDSFSCGGQVADKTGTETYSWDNSGTKAQVSWGGQSASGSMAMTIVDAAGRQVYTKSMSGASQGGASETTASGTAGTWRITIQYSDFTGQLGLSVTSYGTSMCPAGVPGCP